MQDEASQLEFLHRYYSESLRGADQKALIVLTFAVGILLLLGAQPDVRILAAPGSKPFSDLVGSSAVVIARLTFWCIAFGASVLTQWHAFGALSPRSTSSPDDRVFWDHVAARSVAELRAEIEDAATRKDLSGIYANVHNLAMILRAKFRALRTSTFWCFVMICVLTAYFAVPVLFRLVGIS
jgi:hypothetical protein